MASITRPVKPLPAQGSGPLQGEKDPLAHRRWLRRPELDNEDGYCYEEPDGNLVFSPLLRHRKALSLSCWYDVEIGENYLVLNHAPCKASKYAR